MKKWDEMEVCEKIELTDDIEQILSQDDIVDIWNEYYKDDEVMQIEKIDDGEYDGYFIEGYYGGHYFERITECRDFNEQIFDDIYDKLAEFVATSYTNEEVKRRLSVKKYNLQKLNEIIKYGDKVQFTQTPTIEEDNRYIEVEEGIEYHLVYYFREPYTIHFAFIHHYNKDNEYIDTYRVYMDVEDEVEEIIEMCDNYNNL
jgi:hypothetical protein